MTTPIDTAVTDYLLSTTRAVRKRLDLERPVDRQADKQLDRVRASSRYLLDVIDRVPVLVIPCSYGRITELRQAASFFGSVLPATWSFMLALRSRGLGSVLTTFHLAYAREAAELLGIPDNVTQVAMVPVAYTIGTDFKPAARQPVEQITYWDGWRSRTASDTAR